MKELIKPISTTLLSILTVFSGFVYINDSTDIKAENINENKTIDSLVQIKKDNIQQIKQQIKKEKEIKKEKARKAKIKKEQKKKEEEQQQRNKTETYILQNNNISQGILTPAKGVNQGPSGKETYYNLPMEGVISIMRSMGNTDKYWIREDGCKMLGDYIMVAAHLDIHPRGSLVETSLGTGIVCDTGTFAYGNANQIDIATNW